MRRKNIVIVVYLIFNLFLFFLIISSVVILDREQKEKIAENTISLIRESFLITDFRAVSRDIEKAQENNFSKIAVYNNFGKLILKSNSSSNLLNLQIVKNIWSDSNKLHLKGQVYFWTGLDQLILISLKILIGTIFITAPAFAMINNFLLRRESQLLDNENAKAVARLTAQMAHDIRSPIATLQYLSNNFQNFSEDDIRLLQSSLKRVNEIANSHLSVSKDKVVTIPDLNNLTELINELVNEKRAEFPKLNIEVSLNELFVKCVASDLKRILSNLINNSVEAMENDTPKVRIGTFKKDGFGIVRIEDNGHGIPDEVISKIGHVQVSSKVSGNGLGLQHAVEKLRLWNAEFKIRSSDNSGTVIEIIFPLTKSSYVLVDDDELTRLTWETRAAKNKVDLKTFKSIEDFNTSKAEIERNALIYIDSDLGNGSKGEDLALALHKDGFTNISLATGYRAEKFDHLKFLKSVIDKSVPF